MNRREHKKPSKMNQVKVERKKGGYGICRGKNGGGVVINLDQKLFRGGSGWISVARMSFCCVFSIYFDVIGFYFLEYKCLKRWFTGFFLQRGALVVIVGVQVVRWPAGCVSLFSVVDCGVAIPKMSGVIVLDFFTFTVEVIS